MSNETTTAESRLLEKLDTHNARVKRESDARASARDAARERQCRAAALLRPTGLACPVCESELGDSVDSRGPVYPEGYYRGETQRSIPVSCPNCRFEGLRVEYTPPRT